VLKPWEDGTIDDGHRRTRRRKVQDREQWRRIAQEAKAHEGL
jgi:hypothetical protein